MHKYTAKMVKCMHLSGNCKYLTVVGMQTFAKLFFGEYF